MRPLLHVLDLWMLAAASAAGQTPPAPDLKAIARMVDQGQLGPAEAQLRKLLAQGGGPAARDLLGVVLTRQGHLDQAERELQQALAASPAPPAARQHLARVYLFQKREAEAVAQLRRAAAQGALERDLALELARVEAAQGHAPEAERQLRSAADRFQSVQALLRLARLQSERKDAAGALDSLRSALALAPNSEDVLSAYAQLSLGTHAPVAALFALEALTRMCPTVGQYHYLLGVALMQAGDMPAAVEALTKAEQLDPNRVLTLVALGLALNSRKQYAQAKPYLLRSLELEPDGVEAVAALAESEEGTGDLGGAETHARRVLAQAENNATASLVLGLVRMKQERYAEARGALETAVAADPESARAHYQLSLACARLGDDDGSRAQLELYRQKLHEVEERLKALRNQTGLAPGGMKP